MKKIVKIGNKEVEVVANAASPYLYKGLFREDFLLKIQDKTPDPSLFEKMGFIMAMQATLDREKLHNLSIDDFYDWLEGFAPMDVMNATKDLTEVYFQQNKATSSAKKKEG